MTEEEFLKLVNDFLRGRLYHSENWRYTCFNMVTEKRKDNGRMEIRIQYNPYNVGKDSESNASNDL